MWMEQELTAERDKIRFHSRLPIMERIRARCDDLPDVATSDR